MTKPFVIFVIKEATADEMEANRQFFDQNRDKFPFESLIVEGNVDVHVVPDSNVVELRHLSGDVSTQL